VSDGIPHDKIMLDRNVKLGYPVLDELLKDWIPNWAELESAYITTNCTVRELAEKEIIAYKPRIHAAAISELAAQAPEEADPPSEAVINIAEGAITHRIMKHISKVISRKQNTDAWMEKRKAHRMKIVAAVVDGRTDEEVALIKAMRVRERADIEKIRIAAMSALENIEKDPQGWLFKDEESISKMSGLSDVAQVYERIQKMLYRSLDVPERTEQLVKGVSVDMSDIPDEVIEERVKGYIDA